MDRTAVDFKKLPDAPGVYEFIGNNKKVLYVGKATNIRDRVKSYFAQDIAEIRSPLIEKVIQDSVALHVDETDSVLEALILEAKLIKKYQPIGNTDNKDNKSWSYLVITNEIFPRVLVVRERELSAEFGADSLPLTAYRRNRRQGTGSSNLKAIFGPFPSSGQLKEALKIIRRIFPFFDPPFPLVYNKNKRSPTSFIGLSKAQEKTVRFNQSIGLYPMTDVGRPSLEEVRAYRKTTRAIIDIFSARKATLIKRLEREMYAAAKKREFETAEALKRQVFALRHIQDITLIRDELRMPETATFRIEAYDVAHLKGEASRGAMAVIENGEPKKSAYRLFTIRYGAKETHPNDGRRTSVIRVGDDYAASDELLRRRFKHREWPYPQLIVIDGGKGHLNRTKKILKELGTTAEAVSVVKDERHRPREILGSSQTAVTHEAAILLANSEAHRFAITKHRRAFARSRNSVRRKSTR